MRQNALEELPARSAGFTRSAGSIETGSDREAQAGALRTGSGSALRAGPDLEKRFPLALAMYAALAVLVWFTMDAGKVDVFGKPVELRLVPLIVVGGLALRTVLARQAERIRRGGEKGSF
jgi:hypothetical protein